MLGENLRKALERINSARFLSDETIEESIKDIQRALIASDVDVNLVYNLANEIRALSKKKPPEGLSRKEFIVKNTYELLSALLGGTPIVPEQPKTILLLGLFGQGKTTTAAKLARFYKKRGLSVGLVCADVHRPASYEQLKQLSEAVGVDFFGIKGEKDAKKIVGQAISTMKKKDLVIVDSAGRSALDSELIDEVKDIKDVLKPDQIWLVLSADIGQLAKKQAKAFHDAVGINGIIISKADSSAKAGSTIAACAETKAPVYFVGTGEKPDELELFDAKRYIAKIMGYPDLKGLLEKAAEIELESPEELFEDEFNLDVFYKQLKATMSMGPLDKVAEMLGLKQTLPKEQIEITGEKLKKFKIIMDSMTKQERKRPDIINGSRIKRIAKGSGSTEASVRELLRNYKKMERMFGKIKKIAKTDSLEDVNMEKILKKFSAKKKKKFWR
ncbi:MAG: signal recognition particle receptor subunit alpha [Candidatus Diapherotrites archaeon]|nr:signal recognition particle receptor subunit alpha [Candidatus Diapherotrites archaeon]